MPKTFILRRLACRDAADEAGRSRDGLSLPLTLITKKGVLPTARLVIGNT